MMEQGQRNEPRNFVSRNTSPDKSPKGLAVDKHEEKYFETYRKSQLENRNESHENSV
jgi:hypothetical protein